ncbi:MAG: hypothetical protein J3K34DRAFT_407694 [Monoraphidium minutum]|nr:MAG: hypothetical protein J3K34DRAFT_407694 [Monoraphidium minutum]
MGVRIFLALAIGRSTPVFLWQDHPVACSSAHTKRGRHAAARPAWPLVRGPQARTPHMCDAANAHPSAHAPSQGGGTNAAPWLSGRTHHLLNSQAHPCPHNRYPAFALAPRAARSEQQCACASARALPTRGRPLLAHTRGASPGTPLAGCTRHRPPPSLIKPT